MSAKMKKILKNIEARALPHAILILMIFAGISGLFFMLPSENRTASAATVDQFVYNKEIQFDHDQVPVLLKNFTVCVHVTDTDISDACLANGYDIAFFDVSNNQLSHEIEYWNDATGELIAWVKLPRLSATANTTINIYYGDADIGTSAENEAGTWNSGYVAVYHMNDNTTSQVMDSTGNNYDGAKASANNPVQDNGYIGYSQNFSSDFINCTDITEINWAQHLTVSLWWKADTLSAGVYNVLFEKMSQPYDDKDCIKAGLYPDDHRTLWSVSDENDFAGIYNMSNTNPEIVVDEWHYHTYWYDGTQATEYDRIGFYQDGANMSYDLGNFAPTVRDHTDLTMESFHIGYDLYTAGTDWDGRIDELRVSSATRNASWIKMEYFSMTNASNGNFYTFGGEQGSTYSIGGLDANTRFPFSGQAGATVWSTGNITMNIYTNLSSTAVNCTDIFIDFKDGIDVDIDEEQFAIAMINTTGGAWGSISGVLVITNGGNMTINETTWTTGVAAGWAHGPNPFPIDGDDSTIAVRCRVTIPVGKGVGSYSVDDWEVVWKTLT